MNQPKHNAVGSARCADGFRELAVVKGVVHTAARKQFRMVAVFHDASGVQTMMVSAFRIVAVSYTHLTLPTNREV